MTEARTARMKDGSIYEGNQQFQGSGIVKYCPLCGSHKPQLGGHIKHVMGMRTWVCAKHPKVVKK